MLKKNCQGPISGKIYLKMREKSLYFQIKTEMVIAMRSLLQEIWKETYVWNKRTVDSNQKLHE